MTKQLRGVMWALQTARSVGRTLVLPPLRFHTATADVYEYVPFSRVFELEPLAAAAGITDARIEPVFPQRMRLVWRAGRMNP